MVKMYRVIVGGITERGRCWDCGMRYSDYGGGGATTWDVVEGFELPYLLLLHLVGHRSRANTTNLLPQWIRRRRGGGVTNSSRALHKPPVDSIEAMFAAFVRTTNISIQQEHFTAFIVREGGRGREGERGRGRSWQELNCPH